MNMINKTIEAAPAEFEKSCLTTTARTALLTYMIEKINNGQATTGVLIRLMPEISRDKGKEKCRDSIHTSNAIENGISNRSRTENDAHRVGSCPQPAGFCGH